MKYPKATACCLVLFLTLSAEIAAATSVIAGPYQVTLAPNREPLDVLVMSGPWYIEGILCNMWFFSAGDNTINIIQNSGTDFSKFDFSVLADRVISQSVANYGDIEMYTVNGRQWAATTGTSPAIGGIATGGTQYVGCTLINKNTICEVITFSTPEEFKKVVYSLKFESAGGSLLSP